MLNPFPSLLTYALLAPFLIRLTLGAIALWGTYAGFKKPSVFIDRLTQSGVKNAPMVLKVFSVLYGISGIGLILGFYTQIATLLFLTLVIPMFVWEKRLQRLTTRDVFYYVLLVVCSLSLLFTSAGFLAFDLPL